MVAVEEEEEEEEERFMLRRHRERGGLKPHADIASLYLDFKARERQACSILSVNKQYLPQFGYVGHLRRQLFLQGLRLTHLRRKLLARSHEFHHVLFREIVYVPCSQLRSM